MTTLEIYEEYVLGDKFGVMVFLQDILTSKNNVEVTFTSYTECSKNHAHKLKDESLTKITRKMFLPNIPRFQASGM